MNGDDVSAALLFFSPNLPRQLQKVALEILASPLDTQQTLDHVEFFAGFGNVTRAFRDAGLSALSYELKQDRTYQNILTDPGFIAAMVYILKLKPGACMLAAPVCSSWVTINRGTSMRSTTTPLGREALDYVADANKMVFWKSPSPSKTKILNSRGKELFMVCPSIWSKLCDL